MAGSWSCRSECQSAVALHDPNDDVTSLMLVGESLTTGERKAYLTVGIGLRTVII